MSFQAISSNLYSTRTSNSKSTLGSKRLFRLFDERWACRRSHNFATQRANNGCAHTQEYVPHRESNNDPMSMTANLHYWNLISSSG